MRGMKTQEEKKPAKDIEDLLVMNAIKHLYYILVLGKKLNLLCYIYNTNNMALHTLLSFIFIP